MTSLVGFLSVVVFAFTMAPFAGADNVAVPEALKSKIAQAIDNLDWSTEELGSIWVYDVKSEPDSWFFKFIEPNVVQTEFTCGSEYDESEMLGLCEVGVFKKSGQWRVSVIAEDCTCN